MPPLRIAYISESSPEDKHAWSGTVHYTYKSLLGAGFEVFPLGPARPGPARLFLAALNQLSIKVFRKRLDYRHSRLYARTFGKIFRAKLRDLQFDLVVVCGNTECGAYLDIRKPVIYVLDRTIGGAIGYHKILSDLWPFSMRESIYTDRKAMLESHTLIFSSEWAAEHAQNIYGIPGDKIVVIPFGANLDDIPDESVALRPKQTERWKLLFVGTSWQNKGADIALKTFEILNAAGYQVSLTIVGCTPPQSLTHEQVKIIPFIDKNSPTGLRKMNDLFLSHHFFILPTRFDCTPIVFCEASAFGLPILSADTGGVRGHVREGVNGFLLPFQDTGAAYASVLEKLFNDKTAYEKMRRSTRKFYDDTLNWKTWGNAFTRLLGTRGLQK